MSKSKLSTFERKLAERYCKQVFGSHHPVKLSKFLPIDRTYNLMYETDDWRALRDGFDKVNDLSAGVYAFWWLGTSEELNALNTEHKIKGKKESKAEAKLDAAKKKYKVDDDGHIIHETEWFFNELTLTNDLGEEMVACPLYVGKSTNLRNRIRLHLQWPGPAAASQQKKAEHGLTEIEADYAAGKVFKHTTASQFRDGFEYLFRNKDEKGRLECLYNRIGVTLAASNNNGKDDFSDRFYTEDLLIGMFRAPFNLDSER